MFARAIARRSPTLCFAANRLKRDLCSRACGFSEARDRKRLCGRICFRPAPRASARDNGIVCAHGHRALSLECDRWTMDKSKPQYKRAEWPNVDAQKPLLVPDQLSFRVVVFEIVTLCSPRVTRLIVADIAQTGFFTSVDRIANNL